MNKFILEEIVFVIWMESISELTPKDTKCSRLKKEHWSLTWFYVIPMKSTIIHFASTSCSPLAEATLTTQNLMQVGWGAETVLDQWWSHGDDTGQGS